MINMALNGGNIEGQPFIGSAGTNQAISIIFLCKLHILIFDLIVIAIVTVPWMLFTKPLILKKRYGNVFLYDDLNHKNQNSLASAEEIEMKDLNANKGQKKYEIFVEEEVSIYTLYNNRIPTSIEG